MFEYIKGTLVDKEPLKAVVEASGIGYRLSIPLSTYSRLPATNRPIELYLSHIVREDSESLYAFLTKEERDLFEVLLGISGIGPKTALAIIGHTDFATFQRAITAADTRLLSKIPGVGKKTAERLVIEMRDKFNKGLGKKGKINLAGPALSSSGDPLLSDALSALVNLGYAPVDAHKALTAALEEKKDEADLGRLITSALQKM
ncbi:MAG TPA: Holliday junction branch migration protein RuvA [Chlamydiales bacterium]|jgi:Holliday junction DNA helicase RuvA